MPVLEKWLSGSSANLVAVAAAVGASAGLPALCTDTQTGCFGGFTEPRLLRSEPQGVVARRIESVLSSHAKHICWGVLVLLLFF